MAATMRSPNYPALSLPQAIEALGKLWGEAHRASVSHEAAARAMGYVSLSGPARVTIGTLRQYGLVEKPEKGHVQISDLGIAVLHGHGEEQQRAIREAALAPDLFLELSKSHADSSPTIITSYLITKKDFGEDGARKAAKAFKETMALAGSDGTGYTASEAQEKPQAMQGTESAQTAKSAPLLQGEVERMRVSLKGGRLARVVFSGDVPTQADIAKVIASLELQKDSFPED
jgi:hypothetical protein